MSLPQVQLECVTLAAASEAQVVEHVAARAAAGEGGWVVTVNLDILRRICREQAVRELLAPADIFTADGMPLVWASRLQGQPVPERVAGSALVWSLPERAAGAGLRLYLLGGDPGTAEAGAAVLKARYPALDIAGWHCPLMGFEDNPEQVAAMAKAVEAAQPHLVFVALGFPRQERVIAQLRQRLPGAWFVGVGISFSYLTGKVHRPPRWAQQLGVEWLARLLQEPGRLWKRYLVHGIPFAVWLLGRALLRRLGVMPQSAREAP